MRGKSQGSATGVSGSQQSIDDIEDGVASNGDWMNSMTPIHAMSSVHANNNSVVVGGIGGNNSISITNVGTEPELDSGETAKKSLKTFAIVPLLVLIWYSCAVAAITTTKKLMNAVPLPFTLCTSQFCTASIACWIYKNFFSTWRSSKPIQQGAQRTIYMISVAYTLGFVFTNVSFSIISASFAETIKSGEPLSSVFLGYIFHNEGTSVLTYLTLIPICTGVAISCIDEIHFVWTGFLSAAASNFCFSGRAVLAKQLYRLYPGCVDEVDLFGQISRCGLFILIPLLIFMEGKQLWSLSDPESQLRMNLRPQPPRIHSRAFTHTPTETSLLDLGLLLLFNGCAYSCYNLVSFLVLARTNLVTHAVLNVFRRVFIILFTSYYFSIVLTPLNLLGVFMAVVGVILFAISNHQVNKPLISKLAHVHANKK